MRKLVCLLMICSFVFVFAGCKPQGDPKAVLDQYWSSIQKGDYETAYDLLTDENKKTISKEKFIEYRNLDAENTPLKSFEIISDPVAVDNYKDFKIAYKIKASFKEFDNYDEKEVTNTYDYYIVSENNSWKYYYDGSINEDLAYAYGAIGWMYEEGKGKTKDLNQAAICFNNGIKADSAYADNYYALSVTYKDSGRFEEAIDQADKCISIATDSELLSDVYNVKANAQVNLDDYAAAKENYKKAIEINPDNEYAKTNLANLE